VQILNKGGAAGAEGTLYVARSKPDGTTLLVGHGGADLVSAHMQKMDYDVLTDLAPVALLSVNSLVLAVPPNSPFKSVKDVVEWAKKEKKPIVSSITSANGTVDLLVRGLGKVAGVEVTPVPTTGDAASVTMIMGGQTLMGGASLAGAYSHIKSGKIKPIAIATKERDPMLPDVPTMIEQGINYYSWGSVKGVAVAKNSSPEIIAYYEDIFKKISDDAEYKQAMTNIVVSPQYMNTADFTKMFKQAYDDFGKVVKDLGIQKK
jgi:tripartite-type tricarboxylate transporter receptor subunit TctC